MVTRAPTARWRRARRPPEPSGSVKSSFGRRGSGSNHSFVMFCQSLPRSLGGPIFWASATCPLATKRLNGCEFSRRLHPLSTASPPQYRPRVPATTPGTRARRLRETPAPGATVAPRRRLITPASRRMLRCARRRVGSVGFSIPY